MIRRKQVSVLICLAGNVQNATCLCLRSVGVKSVQRQNKKCIFDKFLSTCIIKKTTTIVLGKKCVLQLSFVSPIPIPP